MKTRIRTSIHVNDSIEVSRIESAPGEADQFVAYEVSSHGKKAKMNEAEMAEFAVAVVAIQRPS